MDFRTDFEKRIDTRDAKVCAAYKTYLSLNRTREVSTARILNQLGKDFDLNPMTVRRILIKKNMYQESKRRKAQ